MAGVGATCRSRTHLAHPRHGRRGSGIRIPRRMAADVGTPHSRAYRTPLSGSASGVRTPPALTCRAPSAPVRHARSQTPSPEPGPWSRRARSRPPALRRGRRSRPAAGRRVRPPAGGTSGWAAAGHDLQQPAACDTRAGWSMERQVRFTAGALVQGDVESAGQVAGGVLTGGAHVDDGQLVQPGAGLVGAEGDGGGAGAVMADVILSVRRRPVPGRTVPLGVFLEE